jgi:hypothetical protein
VLNESWGRAVLAVCLAAGSSKAVLTCDPAQSSEAQQIARYLRRTLPQAQIEVASKPTAPVTASAGTAELPGDHAALFVSLPLAGSTAGRGRSVTIAIRTRQRDLTVEIPPDAGLVDPIEVPGGPWSRASAMALGTWHPDRPGSSLPLITSRLNYNPEIQQRTFLNANGFNVKLRRQARAAWGDETRAADGPRPVV